MRTAVKTRNRLTMKILEVERRQAVAISLLNSDVTRAVSAVGINATDSCGASVTCKGPLSVASQKATSVPCDVSRQCRVKIKPACATLFIHQKPCMIIARFNVFCWGFIQLLTQLLPVIGFRPVLAQVMFIQQRLLHIR